MGISVESAAALPLVNKIHLPNGSALDLEQHLSRHAHHHHVSFAQQIEEIDRSEEEQQKEDQAAAAVAEAAAADDLDYDDEDDDDDDDLEEAIDWLLPKKFRSFGIDDRDAGTADEWVHRHPEMVRLTGRHPFNSEAPLSLLMQHGFITPAPLHYVRNHGPVPRASWENWSLEITGLVRKPLRFSMDELLRLFPQREIPVTLVCAGNRRKEQNMVSKSIGFNWGAAGVSTSLWRGVRLCDVLRMARPIRRRRSRNGEGEGEGDGAARFVCFESIDSLPKSGGGYGTCMSIERAMDETQDVLLAFQQNGERLLPDHGFPLRLIVPGCIGGRMVKWLSKITLAEAPSHNHYHHHDNKVFPSHVDPEIASAEGWWTRPEYVINELNINSVITSPAHGEILPINPGTMQTPFTLGGYAYTGGGRRVTRVELSMDEGETWMPCEITQPERPTKHGKLWCWVFWQLGVGVVELLQARELAVRAWDESMNTQPKELIWNLMGMMNNCWFRVKMHPCKGKLGGVAIAFEHPTQPGNQSGGWMVKKKDAEQQMSSGMSSGAKGSLVKSVSSPFLNQTTSNRNITMSEVRKHSKAESPWIVVNNCVYDCTAFIKEHPGGADSILINAGTDCSEEFDAIHSSKAKAMLEDYKIGDLVMTAPSASNLSSSADASPEGSLRGGNRALAALHSLAPIIELHPSGRPRALNPKMNISCMLLSSDKLSDDLRRLRFALPSQGSVLGLPIGKHIFVSGKIKDKLCMRAYTPISSDDDEDCVGCFELLIRVYFGGVHPKFPDGGLMSQHLNSLVPGDSINVKGPLGHIQYLGNGSFAIGGNERRSFSKLALMAGGTGITPVYQVIKAILRKSDDPTHISLVYANRSDSDIMLREELDQWEAEHGDRFHVWYVLSHPVDPESWRYSTGFVTEEVVREHLPAGGSDAAAFMCGPPPMIEFACLPNLAKHGYDKASCFQF